MKKLEKRITNYQTKSMLVSFILAFLLLPMGSPAFAASVGELLKFMPPDTHIALGIPDIAAVEKEAAPFLALPFLSDISSFAVQLGGDTLADGLMQSGIDASGPAVGFIQLGASSDLTACGILIVKEEGKVRETLKSLLGSQGTELILPGDIKGQFFASNGVGYFLHDNKLFLGSDELMLQQLAGRISEPAAINYGKDGPKDEVVAFSRIDILEKVDLATVAPVLAMLKPVLDTIKPFSDEILLAVGQKDGKAYLRVAARDINNVPVEPPAPLTLHGYMDPEAPVVLNLRMTPELTNALSMALMNNPSTRQAGGYTRLVAALLDEEIAVSFAGMKGENVPDAVIAAKVKHPESVGNLMRMIAKLEAPTYKLDENDVYVYPNIAEGTDLHVASAGKMLLVAPGEEALKTALSRFSQTESKAGINPAVVNRGVYGFLVVDGSKVKNLPENVIPENINLGDVNLALTMGVDGEWREIVLSAPAGFSGVANIMKNVM